MLLILPSPRRPHFASCWLRLRSAFVSEPVTRPVIDSNNFRRKLLPHRGKLASTIRSLLYRCDSSPSQRNRAGERGGTETGTEVLEDAVTFSTSDLLPLAVILSEDDVIVLYSGGVSGATFCPPKLFVVGGVTGAVVNVAAAAMADGEDICNTFVAAACEADRRGDIHWTRFLSSLSSVLLSEDSCVHFGMVISDCPSSSPLRSSLLVGSSSSAARVSGARWIAPIL